MLRLAVIAVSVAAIAAPAAAAEKSSQLDRNKVVCKSQGELGTRLSRTKVCKTRAQWEQDAREDRRKLSESELNRQRQ